MKLFIYIAAALVIGLLIGFVALSVSWLRKTMLQNIRSHTLDLLSHYDEILETKSRELSDLEDEISIREADEADRPEERMDSADRNNAEASVTVQTLIQVAERASAVSYRDAAAGKLYYEIKQSFAFQLDELLPSMPVQNPASAGAAETLLKELDFDTVYQLSTLTEQEQMTVLSECLSDAGCQLLADYLTVHPQFTALGFYDYLKSRAAEESQAVRVYVPADMSREAGVREQATVSVDREICEGFQVEMGGKLYDYCIKVKELS